MTDPSKTGDAPARSWFRRLPPVPLAISIVVLVVLAGGGLLLARSTSRVNKVPLSAEPKGVATGTAVAASFQPIAHYVGTVEPWIEARLGPQFVAAYVDTILVRPGAAVRKGQVLGTLDCRNASAESKAVAAQARAIEARQEALAHEASRVGGLLAGGFVSPNEAEQKNAESASKEAELQSTRAKLVRSSLEVDDCILRAPFDGEVGAREMDPGAFARPGTWALSVVDRSVVRVVADVPEADFANVAPGTPVKIRITSTGAELTGHDLPALSGRRPVDPHHPFRDRRPGSRTAPARLHHRRAVHRGRQADPGHGDSPHRRHRPGREGHRDDGGGRRGPARRRWRSSARARDASSSGRRSRPGPSS